MLGGSPGAPGTGVGGRMPVAMPITMPENSNRIIPAITMVTPRFDSSDSTATTIT